MPLFHVTKKMQPVGNSNCVIIPNKWLRKANIKKGDNVSIIMTDNAFLGYKGEYDEVQVSTLAIEFIKTKVTEIPQEKNVIELDNIPENKFWSKININDKRKLVKIYKRIKEMGM